MWRARRFVGKIALHDGKRYENFVDVPSVVTRVLLLFLHHSDDEKRNVIQINVLAQRIAAFGKELLGSVATKESHAVRVVLVVPVVETARTDGETADIAELRIRPGHQKRGSVVVAVSADGV